MTTTNNGAAALRALVKSAGLSNVRVRKGKGCRAGDLHFFMSFDASADDRAAALAFLISIGADCAEGYQRTDLETITPHHFDSITVRSFSA